MLANADEGAEVRKIFIKGSFKAKKMWIEMQTWGLTIGTPGLDNPGFHMALKYKLHNVYIVQFFSFRPNKSRGLDQNIKHCSKSNTNFI